MASPMPRDPPVTIATFPVKDSIVIALSRQPWLRTDSHYNSAPMHDVAIIGAGELGGELAHALARRDATRAIRLIDEAGRVAEGKALDILEGAPIEGFTAELSGTTDVTTAAGAAIIVIADRARAGAWGIEEGLLLL